MAILVNTPAVTVGPVVNAEPTAQINTVQYDGIPVDVFRFFNRDLTNTDSKTLDKMADVSSWAFEGSETVGDAMLKLRGLEMKLGTPTGNETREDKLYNWVKIQKNINDLVKRQDAMRG